MNSKLLFISVFNNGSIDLGINHITSLKNNNINNYLACVTDMETFDTLTKLNFNVKYYNFDTSLTDKMDFGTTKFNIYSYFRYYIIKDFLKQNYDIWYLYTDIVVNYNLNLEYNNLISKNFDFFFQNDINMPCSGCMLFKSNSNNLDLIDLIINNKNFNTNDQIIIKNLLQKLKFNYSLLPLHYYPNGVLFFDPPYVSPPDSLTSIVNTYKKLNITPYIIHANWMIGNSNKINAFKSKKLWFVN
jgi:hypothetical protein